MTRIAEIADLLDASGQRHVHSKVMILAVTTAVVLIVGLVLVVLARHLAWPDVAALGLLLVAPYGLDGYKTLVKLRFGIPGTTVETPTASIAARRAAGAAEGVEPAP
jgi:hypothetical protein